MEAENSKILVLFFIGTSGMLLLAGSIFFFFITYQKRLLKKQLEINQVKANQQEEILKNTIASQEKERKRIGEDLHDEVGAMLSLIKLNVSRIEKKSEGKDAIKLAGETKHHLEELITQVRRISRALSPVSLERMGLFPAVEELAKWANKSPNLNIECLCFGNEFRFDGKMELTMYRTIQELLNNSIKHSRTNKIEILMKFDINKVSVIVRDFGVGFNFRNVKSGLGLENLKSRTELIGAHFKIKSIPNKGTTAIICLNSKK